MANLKDFGFETYQDFQENKKRGYEKMIKQKQEEQENKRSPIKKFKSGLICVNIWENEGEKFNFFTISIDISYKDKKGDWQKTNGCGISDVPRLQMLLGEAYKYVSLKEEQ